MPKYLAPQSFRSANIFSLKRRTAKFPFSPLSPSFALVSPASPQRNRSSYLPPTFTAAAPENHRRTSPFKLPRLQTSRLPYPLDLHLLRRPPHRISFADSIDHRPGPASPTPTSPCTAHHLLHRPSTSAGVLNTSSTAQHVLLRPPKICFPGTHRNSSPLADLHVTRKNAEHV